MSHVIPVWPVPSITVAGGGTFPVRRIYCVGRNYAAHAREMGSDPTREEPFFFTKPADAVVPDGATLRFPSATKNLHHEIELVVALHSGGRDIPTAHAQEHIFGYAAGLDMTRRDLQNAAKNAGRPWDMAKGFDQSAPIGSIQPVSAVGHVSRGRIALTVNGQQRQDAQLTDMIWSVADIVGHLSRLVELAAGDLIFTGTPEGVGPVVPGDLLEGHIDGVGSVTVRYAAS
jgi:fumarylpyruvate hydrolase